MGWRGILRDLQAASRRAEREANRRRRELEKQQQQRERMQEFERVRYEVALYENLMQLIVSVHKECRSQWNWRAIQSAQPPAVPIRGRVREREAEIALDSYTPSIWDRLFGRTEGKMAQLEAEIDEARKTTKLRLPRRSSTSFTA
jgi:hypothetical protein